MSNEIIVGLDIGTTKIACFIGQAGEDGKIKILGWGKTTSIGVQHGEVKNIIDTAQDIRRAVDEASEKANYEVTEVYVGIAGKHIKSMQNRGSIMLSEPSKIIDKNDIKQLIDNQRNIMLPAGEEIIHIIPQTFYVDKEELTVNPIGVPGNCLEAVFHIVTGNTKCLENIKHSVINAGLRIKGVVLEPIASAESTLGDDERKAGVALVDIGGGTTDIAIFEKGVIRHTAVIPIAGNLITKDIHEGCTIARFEQAESLKIKFGCCLPSEVNADDIVSMPGLRGQPPREISMKTLAGIIGARTNMILELVGREIELAGFAKKLIGGIVLTGGGAQLKFIKELTSYITAQPTRIGIPNEYLETPGEIEHPMYSTGVGLVLYGLKEEKDKQDTKQNKKQETSFVDFDNAAEAIEEEKSEPDTTSKELKKTGQTIKGIGKSVGNWLNEFFKDDVN